MPTGWHVMNSSPPPTRCHVGPCGIAIAVERTVQWQEWQVWTAGTSR